MKNAESIMKWNFDISREKYSSKPFWDLQCKKLFEGILAFQQDGAALVKSDCGISVWIFVIQIWTWPHDTNLLAAYIFSRVN